MHLTILTNLALLVASAIAQSSNANPFNIPNGGYSFTAGKASTINWKPTTSGTVTLTLREGANSNLSKGTVIAQSISNSGSFTYTPPSDTVRNSDYAIEISSDSDPNSTNYTPQFVIESSNTVASVSAASSGASVTSAASASSASSASAASSTNSANSASSASSASTASSGASSASSMSASSAASSSSAASTRSGSSSSTTKTASSASNSPTASSTTASVEKAPSSGATVNNAVHGGLAAMAIGAALVL